MKTNEICEKILTLSEQNRKIEKELTELKDILKQKGSGRYGDYIVAVEDRERESFTLKEAKESLTEAVWNKIKDFVKVTAYQQVKVVKA